MLGRMHVEAAREIVESPHVLEVHQVTWWRVVVYSASQKSNYYTRS